MNSMFNTILFTIPAAFDGALIPITLALLSLAAASLLLLFAHTATLARDAQDRRDLAALPLFIATLGDFGDDVFAREGRADSEDAATTHSAGNLTAQDAEALS